MGSPGLDEVRLRHRRFCLDAHAAASQKIDALIVSNAKDPRGEGAAFVPGLKAAVSAKKGVLHHIFAVCDRAGHPGAVSVEPRPKGADGFEKCEISGFEPFRCLPYIHVPLRSLVSAIIRRRRLAASLSGCEAPCLS
jgi:hypothetical protein